MEGTEKQIAWANEIQQTSLDFWTARIDHFAARKNPQWQAIADNMRKVVSVAMSCESAPAWINARSDFRNVSNPDIMFHQMGMIAHEDRAAACGINYADYRNAVEKLMMQM